MKEKVRNLMQAGRQAERNEIQPHVNDSAHDQPGRWTAKDQLAHLTAWRQVAAAEVEAVRTGGPGPAVSGDDDAENERIYQEAQSQPAVSVIEAAAKSWDQLISALESCSDEVLSKPRIRNHQEPLWQVAPDQTFHLTEHLVYLHTEAGNFAGAERAAKWAYEIATATLTDDRGRGTAEYDLGCFYAVRARFDEAMPHLLKGLELRPDLREWAKQDSDLESIRAKPDLAGKLGLAQ